MKFKKYYVILRTSLNLKAMIKRSKMNVVSKRERLNRLRGLLEKTHPKVAWELVY